MTNLTPTQLKDKYHIFAKDSGSPSTQDTATRLADAIENGLGSGIPSAPTVEGQYELDVTNGSASWVQGGAGSGNVVSQQIDNDWVINSDNTPQKPIAMVHGEYKGDAYNGFILDDTGQNIATVEARNLLGGDHTNVAMIDVGARGSSTGTRIDMEATSDGAGTTVSISADGEIAFGNGAMEMWYLQTPQAQLSAGKYHLEVNSQHEGTLVKTDDSQHTTIATNRTITAYLTRVGNLVTAKISSPTTQTGTATTTVNIPDGFKIPGSTENATVLTRWTDASATITEISAQYVDATTSTITVPVIGQATTTPKILTWYTNDAMPTA
jgi:hypothetical protein